MTMTTTSDLAPGTHNARSRVICRFADWGYDLCALAATHEWDLDDLATIRRLSTAERSFSNSGAYEVPARYGDLTHDLSAYTRYWMNR